MRVRYVAKLGPAAPKVWCPERVDVIRLANDASDLREDMARRKGLDYDQCGFPAEYVIDGIGYCRRHAGETLLRAALDETPSS